MASLKTITATCNDIMTAKNMSEVARYIRGNPAVLLNQNGVATILKSFLPVLRQSQEKLFNFDFITTIMELHRARMKATDGSEGIMSSNARPLLKEDLGYRSSNDWALHILRGYAQALTIMTDGKCLRASDPQVDKLLRIDMEQLVTRYNVQKQFCYLGWIVLCCRYNSVNDELVRYVIKDYLIDARKVAAFLYVLTDASIPLSDKTHSIGVMTNVFANSMMEDVDAQGNRPGDLFCTFIDKARKNDLGWLEQRLRDPHYAGGINLNPEDGESYLYLLEDCQNIFIALGNIFNDEFSAQNYFFDYIEELSYYYPLREERREIVARYEQYFEQSTAIIMADFVAIVPQMFGKLTTYRDSTDLKGSEMAIAKELEATIIQLHRDYPDVPREIFSDFFNDVLKSFGRGFRGASDGCCLFADAIIDGVFKRDDQVLESNLDPFSCFYAMESDSSDEDFDDEDDWEDEGGHSLHRRADVRKGAANMKENERKIYKAYKAYKNKEEIIGNKLGSLAKSFKNFIVGDQRKMIIEGRSYTVTGFIKKIFLTVGIFNASKIAGILFLVSTFALSAKCQQSEKKKILAELELELEMVEEKIQDAQSDGNRQAKYELMRTRNALLNAIKRIKIGVGAKTITGKVSSANHQYLPDSIKKGR